MDYIMATNPADADKRKASVAKLSIATNAVLVLLKLIVGTMIGSVSVISEAIHSGVDLMAAVIAFFAVKTSGKPADCEHPFGHGKVENISGTIEAILIFMAAAWIIFEAFKKLLSQAPIDEPGLGVVVMATSATANFFVSRKLFTVGEETDSVALKAAAWHLRTDVLTSAGVLFGLGIIWVGGMLFPGINLHWVDPLAAIGVALLIIRAAYKLIIDSARDLLDVSLPPEEEQAIRKSISAFSPTVRGYHRLCTRKSGSYRFVEFHVRVDASMSIDESHRIADMMTCAIKQQFPGTAVTIHTEPCNCAMADEESCGCLLDEAERKAMMRKTYNPINNYKNN